MSMLYRFLALRGKSELKNVRFLHKLGWRTSKNLVMDSLHVATASRQFIVGRVSFLKQEDNAGLELAGIDCGAGQPAEGALVCLPQSLYLRKKPPSTSSDADNFNRQIKKFRNSRDASNFLDTCDSETLSRSSLICVSGKLFKLLKTEKSNATEKTCILASVGMQNLCRAVQKHSCSISPGALTTICGLFVYLNAPGDHPTFHNALRLISKHASSLTLLNIRFLHSLMNRMCEGSKSRISEEITQVLPVLFERQLSMRLDDTDLNLAELVSCLEYAARNNCSESVLKKILKSIREKQAQLTYKQARKLVGLLWLLGEDRHHLPEGAELLQASCKILAAHNHLLDPKQLKMSRFCGIRSTNSILDYLSSKDSTEAAYKRLTEALLDKDTDTEDEMQIAIDSFKHFTKPWHSIQSQNLPTPPCRHCAAKRESLQHVLGGCPKTVQLRYTRNHEIKKIIANGLRETPSFGQRMWKVEEEVECRDENESIQMVDIFCYDNEQKVGFIIDIKVRFENAQVLKVKMRKTIHNVYKPCSKYIKNLYALDQIKVIGFSVGARGIMTPSFEKFRKLFALSPTITRDVAVAAIRGSTLIAEHHLYSRETDLLKLLG